MGLHEVPWNPRTKRIPNLKGHLLFVDRTAQPRPRAAIYASSNLDMWGVADYTSKDMATAVWLTKDAPFPKVYITATYHYMSLPHEARTPTIHPQLEALAAKCQREGAPLVTLADTNSHSVF